MLIQPHYTDQDQRWHDYAGGSLGVPSPVGYIDATTHYVQNLQELLDANLSLPDMKVALKEFIAERKKFINYAEQYMDNNTYESHPQYTAERNFVIPRTE